MNRYDVSWRSARQGDGSASPGRFGNDFGLNHCHAVQQASFRAAISLNTRLAVRLQEQNDLLHRIEFRTVGRQMQERQVRRNEKIAMPTGAVQHDHAVRAPRRSPSDARSSTLCSPAIWAMPEPRRWRRTDRHSDGCAQRAACPGPRPALPSSSCRRVLRPETRSRPPAPRNPAWTSTAPRNPPRTPVAAPRPPWGGPVVLRKSETHPSGASYGRCSPDRLPRRPTRFSAQGPEPASRRPAQDPGRTRSTGRPRQAAPPSTGMTTCRFSL